MIPSSPCSCSRAPRPYRGAWGAVVASGLGSSGSTAGSGWGAAGALWGALGSSRERGAVGEQSRDESTASVSIVAVSRLEMMIQRGNEEK